MDPDGPHRVQEALSHALTLLECFEGSVVCWNLFGDAGHHTVEETFRRSGRQSFAICRKTI
jgi:hypothetical protein